ncbi:MAG TPA: SBBP repeat-containing protein [Ignavibacteria bacterium]|nr:SBBP repeat-containing protein [Ignavibacteria bacterium]
MKYVIISFTVLIYCTNYTINSQVTQQWVSRYNGSMNGSDVPYALTIDNAGNIYVTGGSDGPQLNDYLTVKYNTTGVQQWAVRYNGPGGGMDRAYSIAVDNAGNVYVTGSSSIGGLDDYATIKYNSEGIEQWVARYNGPANNQDIAYSLSIDGSGNVYVSGQSIGNGTSDDYATIKYNSSGVQQWVARYNGPGNSIDYAATIKLDNLGNIYVTGYSHDVNSYMDYATVKYNSGGTQLWVSRFTGPGNGTDRAYAMAIDAIGNVYVTGYSNQGINTILDYATVKYNTNGVQQWVQTYNGPGNGWDMAYSIITDISGNVYVTGQSSGISTGSDFATIKYNSSGDEQWIQRFSWPNSTDIANSIAVDVLSNVYVTGTSNNDYATIKYNSSGVQQWIQTYNAANGGDVSVSIAVNDSGNVYVTGFSSGSSTGMDYATIKYSQSVGINPISSEMPSDFNLLQNYPNPFNPKTVISYQLKVNSYVNLKVIDITGREVAQLTNEFKQAGYYTIEFDGSNLASGVYFYKIRAGDFTDVKKMVLVK